MAEHPTECTRLNTDLAAQATDVSLNWFRQMAEQNLKFRGQKTIGLPKTTVAFKAGWRFP
jgi:hypothetical protein